MTTAERLNELTELKKNSGNILSDADTFNEWTGRVSALLAFDPIARHKFDAFCDHVHREQDGGRWQLYENVLQTENKIHAILTRAISELEINRRDMPNIIPSPAKIPDQAIIKAPVLDIIRDRDDVHDRHSYPVVTKDEGLLWFWHHCHYTVKWKLVSMALAASGTLLWLGWMANEQEVLRDIGRAFQKITEPPAKTPDSKTDSKTIPPNP